MLILPMADMCYVYASYDVFILGNVSKIVCQFDQQKKSYDVLILLPWMILRIGEIKYIDDIVYGSCCTCEYKIN